jgi:hypothetical protein
MKNIKTGLRRFLVETKAYKNTLFGKKPPINRFVIFAQGRTGSNLLETLVNSHPRIVCEGEILLRRYIKVLYPKHYVAGRASAYPTDTVYGFRLQPYHLNFHKLPVQDFFSFLTNNNWKIIHLRRENFLRQIVSGKIANRKKVWHYHDNNIQKKELTMPQIEINVPQLLKSLEAKQVAFFEEKALLQSISHIEIVYEYDLLHPEKHQETANKIFTYLNLPTVEVATKLEKTPFQDLSKIIVNFQEVAEALKNTKYHHFLTAD